MLQVARYNCFFVIQILFAAFLCWHLSKLFIYLPRLLDTHDLKRVNRYAKSFENYYLQMNANLKSA